MLRVPEVIAFAPALVCRDRAAMGEADLAQLPVETWEETRLESAAFGDRYRLYALAGQDAGWMRELFSPQLIAWLDSRAPEGMSFELNEGNLAVFRPGHISDPDELTELSDAASELAGRIRKEAAEEGADPDLFREEHEIRDLDAAIPAVEWRRPPGSVGEAIEAYRKVAGHRLRVLFGALLWAVAVGAVVGAAFLLVAGPIAAAAAAILGFGITLPIARFLRTYRYRFGSVPAARVGLEAWTREYAAARGLELQDRWGFHAEMRDLPMPGVADHVLAGKLPGSDRTGRLVMLGDAPELRSAGREIAYTADRPLAATGVLTRFDSDPPADLEAKLGGDLPEEYKIEQLGRDVMVWRPVAGNMLRTSEGTDRFCARACEVLNRAEGA